MFSKKGSWSIYIIVSALLLSSCQKRIVLKEHNFKGRFNRVAKSTDMEMKYKAAMIYFDKKKYYNALQLFEELIPIYKGSGKAESIYYYYSLCYYNTSDYISAAYHFSNFAQTFPSSPHAEDALYYNAYCYYLDAPESSLDQQSSVDAIKQFQLFANRYPNSQRLADCNKYIDELRFKLETKAYDNARLYYKMQDYKSAVVALGNVVKDFPATIYRQECLFLMLKSAYLYAGNSIETKKEERYKNAVEHYAKLMEAFPESRYKKDAEKLMEEINYKLAAYTTKNG